MAALHRLAQHRTRRIVDLIYVDGSAFAPGQGNHLGAFTPHRGKERTRCSRIVPRKEAGTPQDPEDRAAVLDQGQGDGVLLPAQKPLGAVQRVNGPEPAVGIGFPSTVGDGVEHLFRGYLPHPVPDEQPDHFHEALVLPQEPDVFLPDDRVTGKALQQLQADDRLTAEIGHGNGRPVLFLQRFQVQ